jgi:hypothetical protein
VEFAKSNAFFKLQMEQSKPLLIQSMLFFSSIILAIAIEADCLALKIRGFPVYEKRLIKYTKRGFAIVDQNGEYNAPLEEPLLNEYEFQYVYLCEWQKDVNHSLLGPRRTQLPHCTALP